jgi:predicted MFS family arabinose efflux permease
VLANAVMLAPWSLTLSVGLPLLVAERGLGLPALAVLMGAYGVGDVLGNILASARIPRRPYLQMFAGYLWMGSFFVAAAMAPGLPLMAMAALLAGLGGPFFFLQFLATVQSRLAGADLTALLRLRLAIVAGAMMLGAAIGPLPFHALGAASTVALCGAMIAAVGLWGMLRAARSEHA